VRQHSSKRQRLAQQIIQATRQILKMNDITLRFYGELNDFLPVARRQVSFGYSVHGPQSIKHLMEAIGVPHPEVTLILANGEPVGFAYQPQPGDRLALYPNFTGIEIRRLPALRPPTPDPIAFLGDNHLGKLVRLLRLLGFDTTYASDLDDELLAEQAHDENRVLLTRDRGLLKRKLVIWGYCLRSTDSTEQLRAVLRRFQLFARTAPWTRCLRCNGLLMAVDKTVVWDRLEPKTRLYYDDFRQCRSCEQVYWQGSHVAELTRLIADVQAASTH
jgi:uncharacterized protein